MNVKIPCLDIKLPCELSLAGSCASISNLPKISVLFVPTIIKLVTTMGAIIIRAIVLAFLCVVFIGEAEGATLHFDPSFEVACSTTLQNASNTCPFNEAKYWVEKKAPGNLKSQ